MFVLVCYVEILRRLIPLGISVDLILVCEPAQLSRYIYNTEG